MKAATRTGRAYLSALAEPLRMGEAALTSWRATSGGGMGMPERVRPPEIHDDVTTRPVTRGRYAASGEPQEVAAEPAADAAAAVAVAAEAAHMDRARDDEVASATGTAGSALPQGDPIARTQRSTGREPRPDTAAHVQEDSQARAGQPVPIMAALRPSAAVQHGGQIETQTPARLSGDKAGEPVLEHGASTEPRAQHVMAQTRAAELANATGLDAQLSTRTQPPLLERSGPGFASSPERGASAAGATTHVRIGTVEVRVASTAPRSWPEAPIRSRHGPVATRAESLARPFGWRYGLAQE